jgi:hypothetical protein
MEMLRRENSGIAVNGEGSVGTSTNDLITIEPAPRTSSRLRSHSSRRWRMDGDPSAQYDLCLADSDVTAGIARIWFEIIA